MFESSSEMIALRYLKLGTVPRLCYLILITLYIPLAVSVNSFQHLSPCAGFVETFRFGFDGGVWDLIVLVPDYCLSFNFSPGASSSCASSARASV